MEKKLVTRYMSDDIEVVGYEHKGHIYVNVTAHNINLRDEEGVEFVVPQSGLQATVDKVTEPVEDENGIEIVTETLYGAKALEFAFMRLKRSADNVIIVGSMIARDAYPGVVYGMTSDNKSDHYCAPQDKKKSATRFVTASGSVKLARRLDYFEYLTEAPAREIVQETRIVIRRDPEFLSMLLDNFLEDNPEGPLFPTQKESNKGLKVGDVIWHPHHANKETFAVVVKVLEEAVMVMPASFDHELCPSSGILVGVDSVLRDHYCILNKVIPMRIENATYCFTEGRVRESDIEVLLAFYNDHYCAPKDIRGIDTDESAVFEQEVLKRSEVFTQPIRENKNHDVT